jgi:hypothetical protein
MINPFLWNPIVDIWKAFFNLAHSPFSLYWTEDVLRFVVNYVNSEEE